MGTGPLGRSCRWRWDADFDRWIAGRCLAFDQEVERRGQRSLPPGVYFRMLLVGYFEGISSQHGIAWRCADSLRTYIPEPKRKSTWSWIDKTPDHERTFAHVCETGGMRRSWLKGVIDVTKRYVMAAAAHNLGRLLRTLTGVGKPRSLQGAGLWTALATLLSVLRSQWEVLAAPDRRIDGSPVGYGQPAARVSTQFAAFIKHQRCIVQNLIFRVYRTGR